MPRVERHALLKAPPEAVWAALVDPARRARWLASMREEQSPAPLAVGTRVTSRRTAPGSRSTYVSTVKRLDPPRRMEMDVARNGEHVATGGYALAATPEGTRVTAYGEFELKGLQRMMTPIVAAGMEKELEADLAGLKRHLEV